MRQRIQEQVGLIVPMLTEFVSAETGPGRSGSGIPSVKSVMEAYEIEKFVWVGWPLYAGDGRCLVAYIKAHLDATPDADTTSPRGIVLLEVEADGENRSEQKMTELGRLLYRNTKIPVKVGYIGTVGGSQGTVSDFMYRAILSLP